MFRGPYLVNNNKNKLSSIINDPALFHYPNITQSQRCGLFLLIRLRLSCGGIKICQNLKPLYRWCLLTSAWWWGWCSVSGQCSTWPALREEHLHRDSRVWEGRHQPVFPDTPAHTAPRPPAPSTASASRPSEAEQQDRKVRDGEGLKIWVFKMRSPKFI